MDQFDNILDTLVDQGVDAANAHIRSVNATATTVDALPAAPVRRYIPFCNTSHALDKDGYLPAHPAADGTPCINGRSGGAE